MTADAVAPRHARDPFDVRRTLDAPPPLAPYSEAGLLTPADVHTAMTLTRLVDADADDRVVLAVALAVRAPRLRHVCIDLASAADTVVADGDVDDLDELVWPDPDQWCATLAGSPLVAVPDTAGERPLVLDGSRLYLDRYHRYERSVAGDLAARAGDEIAGVDLAVLHDGLGRLFPAEGDGERPDRQRLAAATAVLRRLAVIAGGPGTGKTATVAAVLALLHDQARAGGGRAPRIGLAAPTGKAAARLTASLHAAAGRLDVDPDVRATLAGAEASTLHRLLGARGTGTRFRHHRDDPLPHDVVVVDETSMVSLSLVARLLAAVRRDARLILLGDPEQLASVEAGTVLGDLVGPARDQMRWSPAWRDRLATAAGEQRDDLEALVAAPASPTSPAEPPEPAEPAAAGRVAGIGDGIVLLERVHRFGADSGIAELAAAVRRGDVAATLDVLDRGGPDVAFVDAADPTGFDELDAVRDLVVAAGTRLVRAARAGDAGAALAAVDDVRVLCAHRRGPHGVADWIARVERWLVRAGAGIDVGRRWYPGRPVVVTKNDHRLGVLNGDVGVTLTVPSDAAHDDETVTVAFEGADAPRRLHPGRLEAVDTVHAMTIHRSQGSQFGHVVVVLPPATSPILTRELFYTAVTRAQEQVTVVASRDAVRAAVDRRIARASGLRDALWGPAVT